MMNHRYRIVEKLGEGGSGEVFLVEDVLKNNQRLAVKILHSAEKVGVESDQAFRNEVSQLIQLSHPNLVRILDCGTVRHAEEEFILHRRFFTMEYIEGVDALEWIASHVPPGKKEALLEIVLLQALSVLAYVHREGVIHFDIKPANLVLVEQNLSSDIPIVKLMDFGFSKKQSELLEVSIRGTLEYTAPELLRGDRFDYRVDLYSVGATFYHLLEGQCPFESKQPVELVKRILSEEPVFPADDSSRIRKVIRTLLEKDPSQRFSSAEEAARMLVKEMPDGNDTFLSYFGRVRKPGFVGRKSEVATLRNAIAALTHPVEAPQPSAVVITGAEGIGKTSLIREAVKRARSLELQVYELETLPSHSPFQAIATILPLLYSDVRSFSDQASALVDRYATSLDLDRPDAPRFDVWGEKKEAFVEILSRFLVDCSTVFPFVIVADNLHLADDQSVRVLQITLRDVSPGRILVLAAEMDDVTPALPSGVGVHMPLSELGEEDVKEMSTAVLGHSQAVGEIGSRLFSLYGGTPLMVVEALNALAELIPAEGLHKPETAKQFIAELESQLPGDVDEFLMLRFRKLNGEQQMLLNILACFQFPVRPDVLLQCLPFHRLRSTDHIRFLLIDGFLGTADNDRVLFIRMKRLKDAIYAANKADRLELHSLIAWTLEQQAEESDFTELQELAFQFSASGAHEKAGRYYEQAAEAGAARFALQRSLQLVDHAIDEIRHTADTDRLLRLQVGRVRLLYQAGLHRDAVGFGETLSGKSDLGTMQRRLLLRYMGLSFSRLGENDKAEELITAVLQVSTDEVERLELRQELVGLEISAGQFKQAELDSLGQLELAETLKNHRLLGAIYTDLGIASFFQDKFDDAARYFADALKAYELINEKSQVVNALNNIGNALSAAGNHRQAIQFWERALRASLEFGTLHQQAQIYSNLGIAHYNLKQYSRAKEFYTTALELCRRIDSKVSLAHTLTNLGEVTFAEGEYESALDTWQQAKELYRMMDNPHAITETCLHIAEVFARLGDVQTMDEQLDHARTFMETHSLDSFSARHAYLNGLSEQKKGNYAEAERAFEKACVLHKADQSRELFFEAVIKKAECMFQGGDARGAADTLDVLSRNQEIRKFPSIAAEINYVLGTIASVKPDAVKERAIVYFKQGMEGIAKEPVSETTWKLAYALAREYYERGQHERAREYLVKTKLVLQFFLSHFRSDLLREQYLEAEHKDRIFATIDSITKH